MEESMGKIVSLLRQPIVVMLLLTTVLLTTAITAGATPGRVTWTSQADFESNGSTTGIPTTRSNIDTSSSPGDVKIGNMKDFASTATISYATRDKKVYSTGADRTSIAVVDSETQSLITKIALPAPATGVVYNSTNNKLYVGQYNNNNVIVIDCGSGVITKVIPVGTGPYAAVFNSIGNKVYIANVADQSVSIINGQDDTLLQAPDGKTLAGATTATFDADANMVYLTNKANSFVTIINGSTDQIVKTFEVEAVPNLLGGALAGNAGLQADAQALPITASDKLRLVWNYDVLGQNQNIQFQVRTAPDAATLASGSVLYTGPDGTGDSWYDASSALSTVTDGNTSTSSADLNLAFNRMTEIQFKMSSDGVTSPVLHSVDLVYQMMINASAGPGGSISPSGAVPVEFGADQTFCMTPDVGYHLNDVLVDGASQGAVPCYTFSNVTASHTISASFAINTYTLTYLAGANGTISGPTPQVVRYHENGTQVCAVPDPGYHFVSWSDNNSTNPCRTESSVSADLTATANFGINIYTLTYSAGPNGAISGTSPQLVPYHGSGTQVCAVPATGYHFVSWSDNGSTNPCRTDANVSADITATASFDINIYTLNYSAGPNGTISGTSPQLVIYHGTGTQVCGVPNTGYHFVSWSDNGSTNPCRTDANVAGDITATANFAINMYTLTYSAGPNGTISGTSPQTVPYRGSGTQVCAVPNSGYGFVAWSDNGSTTPCRTDANVSANVTTTASFSALLPDLVVTTLTPPATAIPGLLMSVPVTVTNVGTAPTGTYYWVDFYLCPTATKNGSCVSVASKMFSALAAGAQQSINLSATVPGVASGTWYLGAIADSGNQITESNENNNTTWSPMTILKGPDYVMTAITTPSTATAGQQITVPVTVKNVGQGPGLSSSYVGLYLCPTSTITTSCTDMRDSLISGLQIGETKSFNVTTNLPAGVRGTYYIGAYADDSNLLEEMSETNNGLAGGPTTIN
jgi:YVTN family beta-propeller protein